MLVLSTQISVEERSALVDWSMHTFVEEWDALVSLAMHTGVAVAVGTAAATRLEVAGTPAAESHFDATSGPPTEGIRAGDSDAVAALDTADTAAGIADNAVGVAVELLESTLQAAALLASAAAAGT